MKTWDTYFIEMAQLVASKSKDPSTKVGCVLVGPDHQVISTGFNGFPRGVIESKDQNLARYVGLVDEIEKRWERPAKYLWTEHAERNALYNAARHGIRTEGATAYLNFAPYPCENCMRGFIQAGVVEVVGPDIPFPGVGNGKYYETNGITILMAQEASVRLRIASEFPIAAKTA